jgi:glycosyltransferase involved in cell wall biosynthesis
MALGNCVIVNNTKENLETIGDAGLCYPGNLGAAGLRPVLAHVIAHPQIVEEYRQRAAQRAHTHYSWDAITDLYEEMFHRLVTRR